MIGLWFYFILNAVRVHVNQIIPYWLQHKLAERRVIQNVRQAYKNVPYYKEKYDKAGIDIKTIKTVNDLKRLPYITKDEIREQFPNGIVSRNVDIKKCHYSATTGSTGRSLPFIFSFKTFSFYIATGLRLYTMIGYRPWHKMTYIKYTSIRYPRFGIFLRTNHIPSTIALHNQIEMLKKSKADLLIGYASLVFEIAQTVTPEDLKHIKLKFIGVNSELSTQEERDFISRVFNCPVYDEYSTEETWMIASQCRHNKYHIFTDNVWVEFINSQGKDAEPGEVGEIFLTTLRSPAMPFIRYRIGDLGRHSNDRCKCGSGFPVLEAFEGRSDDSFILPSGKYVSSLKILNTFTKFITKYLHLMEEFKVIQKKPGLITILLVKGKEYKDEHFQELISKLHEIFAEPVTIVVEIVDSIDTKGSIKRKAIESLVSHGAKENEKVFAGNRDKN